MSLHSPFISGSILTAMQACRRQTLQTIAGISAEVFSSQAHPDFSPVGWHLGHIAYTESLWIGERQYERQYEQLFSADGLPKAQRQNLPDLAEILAYMAEVRVRTLRYLENSELPASAADETLRLWHWLVQHEAQHVEIITMVMALHQRQGKKTPLALPAIQQASPVNSIPADMLLIPAGDFCQGYDVPEAIDNERPVHKVSPGCYWIDRAPITCGQYRQFIQAGGYQMAKWWCEQGWEWQQRSQITRPLYWIEDAAFDDYPVMGVSWYEADAYARAVGKRLPTESEWAKAAGCQPMLGNVWEWTNTWFAGYPGFRPFPYEGYSQLYFDGAHRVLRGGSWATPSWALRNSFRNWYHPHRRELFAGFRCAA